MNETDWIELRPGIPWTTATELNRIARQQGLCKDVGKTLSARRNDNAIGVFHQLLNVALVTCQVHPPL